MAGKNQPPPKVRIAGFSPVIDTQPASLVQLNRMLQNIYDILANHEKRLDALENPKGK